MQRVPPRGKMSLELFAPNGEQLASLETSKIDELAAGLEQALEEYDARPRAWNWSFRSAR